MSDSESENENDRAPSSTASDITKEESDDSEQEYFVEEDGCETEEPENLNQDLRCGMCNKHFTTLGGYNRHMARHNIQQNGLPFPHDCQYCGWGFVRADHLNNHKARCKNNPSNFKGKKLVNKKDLRKALKPKQNNHPLFTETHLKNVLRKLLGKKDKSGN